MSCGRVNLALCCYAAGVPGGSVLGSGEERIRAAIASLVAVLPFWLRQQQQHILQQLGQLMDEVVVSSMSALHAYLERMPM